MNMARPFLFMTVEAYCCEICTTGLNTTLICNKTHTHTRTHTHSFIIAHKISRLHQRCVNLFAAKLHRYSKTFFFSKNRTLSLSLSFPLSLPFSLCLYSLSISLAYFHKGHTFMCYAWLVYF